MTDNNNGGLSCGLGCWALAAGVGALTFILLMVLAGFKFFAAAFLGALAFALLGALFNWLFCAPLPKPGEVKPGDTRGLRAEPPAQSKAAMAGGAAVAAGAAAAATASKAKDDAAAKAKADAAAAKKKADAEAAAAKKAADAEAAAAKKAAEKEAAAKKAADAKAAAAASAAATAVKPSKALSGEEELDAKKGEWKYEAEEAPKPKKAAPKKKPAAKKAAKNDGDYDGDGKVEGKNEGKKPKTLKKARAGGADDLKKIKGVGPKMEKLCNELGFFHFDQVASWTKDEVAWVDANLEGFKGRVSRDEWVKQAKLLAAGKETEFSKKVDKGGVY